MMKFIILLLTSYSFSNTPCFAMEEDAVPWERICTLTNRVEKEKELSPEQRRLIKQELAGLYNVCNMLKQQLELAFKYVESTENLILEQETRDKMILEVTKINKEMSNKRKRESEEENNKYSYKKIRENEEDEEDLTTHPSFDIPGI